MQRLDNFASKTPRRTRSAASSSGTNLGKGAVRHALVLSLLSALMAGCAPLAASQSLNSTTPAECRASVFYGATVGDPNRGATGDGQFFVGSFTILNHAPDVGNATVVSGGGPTPGWLLSWRCPAGERIQVHAGGEPGLQNR